LVLFHYGFRNKLIGVTATCYEVCLKHVPNLLPNYCYPHLNWFGFDREKAFFVFLVAHILHPQRIRYCSVYCLIIGLGNDIAKNPFTKKKPIKNPPFQLFVSHVCKQANPHLRFSPTRFVNSPCLGVDGGERTLFQPFPMRVIESECWTAKESTKKGPQPLFASNPWRGSVECKRDKGTLAT